MRQGRTGDRPLRAVRSRMQPVNRRPVAWKRYVAGGLLLAALGGVLAFRLTGEASEYFPLTMGTVEVVREVEALAVRSEEVMTAPLSGLLRLLVEEGQRVRVGTAVAEISKGKPGQATTAVRHTPPPEEAELLRQMTDLSTQLYQTAIRLRTAKDNGDSEAEGRLQRELDRLAGLQADLATRRFTEQPVSPPRTPGPAEPAWATVSANASGVISFQVDGMESLLQPSDAAQWTPSWLRGLTAFDPKPVSAGAVSAGQPLFKVTDSFTVGLVAVVPEAVAALLPLSGEVQVHLALKEAVMTNAKVLRKATEGEETLLYLTLAEPPRDLLRLRRVRVRLVLASFVGKVVPRTALDQQNGLTGVWTETDGVSTFTPVTLIGGNETDVVVQTSLALGDWIVSHPPARKD